MQSIINQIKQGLEKTEVIDKAIETLKSCLAQSEVFFEHSLRTALILKQMGADEICLVAAILHHFPEKTQGETK